jgi:hypothetical protein
MPRNMVYDRFTMPMQSKNRRISAGFARVARRRPGVTRPVNDLPGINHSLTKFVDS